MLRPLLHHGSVPFGYWRTFDGRTLPAIKPVIRRKISCGAGSVRVVKVCHYPQQRSDNDTPLAPAHRLKNTRSLSLRGGDGQPADVCREGGTVNQVAVIGEKRSVQPVGQNDVDGVGHGHVMAVGPGVLQQRPYFGSSKGPVQEPVERLRRLVDLQHAVQLPPPQHAGDFDEEVLRYRQAGSVWDEQPQRLPPDGLADELGASRSIDDDNRFRAQTSPSARASASVSEARTPTSIAG